MTIIVKLVTGTEIVIEYDDLLAVRRSTDVIPATVELVLEDKTAAELIDQLFGPEPATRYLQ
jgi:NAD-dependent DNA ligase